METTPNVLGKLFNFLRYNDIASPSNSIRLFSCIEKVSKNVLHKGESLEFNMAPLITSTPSILEYPRIACELYTAKA